MKHYDFATRFRSLHEKATGLYASGNRNPETYFTGDELNWLGANGISAQHVYDYAEDRNNYGEPDFETALSIEMVRRDYFLNVQSGRSTRLTIDAAKLPAKTDAVRGIAWLPRLIPKAKAKLRGELPATLMYCCGGDRNFFKTHDIHPAEFLSLLWRHERDNAAIVDWVVRRSSAAA